MNGLILQGGGARGAYQAGYLLGLSEIIDCKQVPFNSISGISVGAINASILSMDRNNFRKAALKLKNYWLYMGCNDVYDLGRWGILSSWSNLFGNDKSSGALFDNQPLKKFLSPKINFDLIEENSNQLVTPSYLNIHTYSYSKSKNILFTNSKTVSGCNERYSKIGIEHIIASTAIPYVFPSNYIENEEFGDGGIQLTKPSLPLIQQGCKRIMGITLDHCSSKRTEKAEHIFGAIFPDSLKSDFDKIQRKNLQRSPWSLQKNPRLIRTMLVRPSLESYNINNGFIQSLPRSLNLIAKAFNLHTSEKSTILNYIVFDKEYASYLIETGYKDAINNSSDLLNFFN